MRFSSVFQHKVLRQPAGEVPGPVEAAPEPPPAQAPAQELPDDLDARVRLVGEWQLLES